MEAYTTSTHTSDDCAHRGKGLQAMPLCAYQTHVRRACMPGRTKAAGSTFFFEARCALARSYVEEVVLTNALAPASDKFHCPTWEQRPGPNSMLKAPHEHCRSSTSWEPAACLASALVANYSAGFVEPAPQELACFPVMASQRSWERP